MMVIGSRNVSYWFDLGGADNVMDGSPFDRIIFLAFNIAGIMILINRKIIFSEVIYKNVAISIFFLYAANSILWSDIPFVAMKRFIKAIGNPVMALVVLSEPDPVEAIKTILRRCAYALIPLSIICIKYYPHTGRHYHVSGDVMYSGVTGQKNELGLICTIFCIIFVWCLINIRERKDGNSTFMEYFVPTIYLSMNLWLLYVSDSATSWMCTLTGLAILIGTRFQIMKNHPKYINIFIIIGIVFIFISEYIFEISKTIISSLGRDSTLTTRVPMWDFLIGFNTDFLFGTGYDSFWTLNRIRLADETFRTHSAHNGYLDIYLNLGIIGFVFFTAVILATYRDINAYLEEKFDFSVFRLTILVTILLYSCTEAYLSGLNLLYFLFFLVSIKCPTTYDMELSEAVVQRD
jgi:O-antigen ligase